MELGYIILAVAYVSNTCYDIVVLILDVIKVIKFKGENPLFLRFKPNISLSNSFI
jgi:hypothetical protein